MRFCSGAPVIQVRPDIPGPSGDVTNFQPPAGMIAAAVHPAKSRSCAAPTRMEWPLNATISAGSTTTSSKLVRRDHCDQTIAVPELACHRKLLRPAEGDCLVVVFRFNP